MQPVVTRTAILAGSLVLFGAVYSANAATLYDSGGFEASAGFVAGTGANGVALVGQTAGSVNPSTWIAYPSPNAAANVPIAGVYTYGSPTGSNVQYVQMQTPNSPTVLSADAGSANYYGPNHNDVSPYTPAANEGVAIVWQMTEVAAGASPFFGISAYGSGGQLISDAGINGSTGLLVGGDNVSIPASSSGFTAAAQTTYNYELLLDFGLHQYSIYTAPSGSGGFTLRSTGTFSNAITTFEEADLTMFGTTGSAYTGTVNFDYYSVQTSVVPEPACIGLASAAFGLLGVRRRRPSPV